MLQLADLFLIGFGPTEQCSPEGHVILWLILRYEMAGG
jgi:hypothetical protein